MSRKTFFLTVNKFFLLASWRSMTKIAGSGSASKPKSGSGSIRQRHGSADPDSYLDPHQMSWIRNTGFHQIFPRRICTRCCWGRSSRPAWPSCCSPAAPAYKQLMMRRQLWRRRSSARITWRSCCRWFRQLWTIVWQLRPFGRCFQFKIKDLYNFLFAFDN